MPAGADYLIAVTFTPARLLHRKRQKRVVIRSDLIAFFGKKRNEVDRMSQAAVTFIAQKFLDGISLRRFVCKANGGGRQAQYQQTQKAC
jgi:hypothetical protein